MVKLDKSFFKENEVLFVGYSGKNQGFSKMVYQVFSKQGIKVYPINSKEQGNYDIKVYKQLEDLPKIPETAYVLLNKKNTQKALKKLADSGVKRILFQSRKTADQSILDECAQKGIETIVACPMMKFGSGLHKIHGFLAGVK